MSLITVISVILLTHTLETQQATIRLDPISPFNITADSPPPSIVHACLGDTVDLRCSFYDQCLEVARESSHSYKIYEFGSDQDWNEIQRGNLSTDEDHVRFTVNSTTEPSTTLKYSCCCFDTSGPTRTRFSNELSVHFVRCSGNLTKVVRGVQGDDLILRCDHANDQMDLVWQWNGSPLLNQTEMAMTIPKAQASDGGIYRCLAMQNATASVEAKVTSYKVSIAG